MTHVIRSNGRTTFVSNQDLHISEQLEVGTYSVGFDQMTSTYFLSRVQDLTNPKRIYGDTLSQSTRIINTFLDRDKSTGIYLSGNKGAGKTLLARQISIDAAAHGISTILVNEPFRGDTFNQFVQAINFPTVVLFDEFEKIYETEDQEKLLTLLDGTYGTKKLFVITANDGGDVTEYLFNRPGRIFYHFEYNSLAESVVRAFIADNLINQGNGEAIINVVANGGSINFDSLVAAVEEMNRYDETFSQVLEVLNIEIASPYKFYSIEGRIGDHTQFIHDDAYLGLIDLDHGFAFSAIKLPNKHGILSSIKHSTLQNKQYEDLYRDIVLDHGSSGFRVTAENITSFDPKSGEFVCRIEGEGTKGEKSDTDTTFTIKFTPIVTKIQSRKSIISFM